MLVHVCRRWRVIVFASPRRLDLRLICTSGTPAKEILHIWPILPIEIWATGHYGILKGRVTENIIAGLEHNDRVCRISFRDLPSFVLEMFAAEMQKPFPTLTHLEVIPLDKTRFPKAFLGGSVPCLRSCILQNIIFPEIWELLMTARHLVDLRFRRIPRSTSIPPKALVLCLSMIPDLKRFEVDFPSRSPRSHPDLSDPSIRRLPPLRRVVHHALTHFSFSGTSEYMEDLVTQIDMPRLQQVDITFVNRVIFNTARLYDFLPRPETLNAYNGAVLVFEEDTVYLKPNTSPLTLGISCRRSDQQLSSMTRSCDALLPLISTLERLELVIGALPGPRRKDYMGNARWLALLRQFKALEELYLASGLAPLVAPALQELAGESAPEVLPALRYLVIGWPQPSGPTREAIGKFVAARRLSGRPITVCGL